MEEYIDLIIYGIYGIIILVTIIVVYNIRKAKKNRKKRKELEVSIAEALNTNDTRNIANSNMKLIVKYYDQNLLQHRMTFFTTLIIASLGFITILMGLLLFFNNEIENNTNIAYMTSAGGIIAELISVLFFSQNSKVMKQLKENHQSLKNGLDLETAISLAENLPEEDKNLEMKKIISLLLNKAIENPEN